MIAGPSQIDHFSDICLRRVRKTAVWAAREDLRDLPELYYDFANLITGAREGVQL